MKTARSRLVREADEGFPHQAMRRATWAIRGASTATVTDHRSGNGNRRPRAACAAHVLPRRPRGAFFHAACAARALRPRLQQL